MTGAAEGVHDLTIHMLERLVSTMDFESTVIKDEVRNNLHVSWEEEDGFLLFFTPDMENTDNHYHIELTEDESLQLALFLNRKLEELRGERGNEG